MIYKLAKISKYKYDPKSVCPSILLKYAICSIWMTTPLTHLLTDMLYKGFNQLISILGSLGLIIAKKKCLKIQPIINVFHKNCVIKSSTYRYHLG